VKYQVEALAVLKEYNAAMLYYGRTKRCKQMSEKNLAPLRKFAAWCAENEVPADRFAVAVIQQVYDDTKRFPAFTHLKSKRLLEDDQWQDYEATRRQIEADEAWSKAPTTGRDHVYTLTHAGERIKAFYKQDRTQCSFNVRLHAGWHPQSKHCDTCVQAPPCRTEVDLRFGRGVVGRRNSVRPAEVKWI
jgi:hypothetical protein